MCIIMTAAQVLCKMHTRRTMQLRNYNEIRKIFYDFLKELCSIVFKNWHLDSLLSDD